MPPKPTIVFDLDGTLVDTGRDLVATLNTILATQKIDPVTYEAAVGYVGGGARLMIERAYAAANLPLAGDKLEILFQDFLAHYEEHIADTSRPFPGTEAMLDRFAAEGWNIAVCTNKVEGLSRKLLDLLGLSPRFAVIAGRDTFGVAKPDPRHLLETIRAAGGVPETAVMIGDSRTDTDTAIAANIPVVAVSFGYTNIPVTELGANAIVDHFDELFDTVVGLTVQPSRRT